MDSSDLPAVQTRTPPLSTLRNAPRPEGGESPIAALVNSLLHPLLVVATLIACVHAYGKYLTGHYLLLAVLAFFICFKVFEKIDLFVPWSTLHLTRLARGIVVNWAVVAALLLFLGYATELTETFQKEVILTWFSATPFVLLIGTKIARSLARRAVVTGAMAGSAIVVGANEQGRELAGRLRRDFLSGVRVHGYFDDREPHRWEGIDSAEVLGQVKDAPDYVKRNAIDRVYIALPIAAQPRITMLINELRDSTASIYFVPHLFVFDLMQARVDVVSGIPVIAMRESPYSGFNAVLKRASDLAMSSVFLLLTLPTLLLIALAVKMSSPGPVLFRQYRYGLGGERIMIYKFRTMVVQDDNDLLDQATKDDKRVTRVGAFLRRTSLDELPQLFNVLGGSMSIVGPRPHAVVHNEQYRKLIDGYMIRHKVRPGMTGWAQVNGFRGETQTLEKMQRRIECDLEYMRNWSLSLDLWIIVRTILTVWRDRNAY